MKINFHIPRFLINNHPITFVSASFKLVLPMYLVSFCNDPLLSYSMTYGLSERVQSSMETASALGGLSLAETIISSQFLDVADKAQHLSQGTLSIAPQVVDAIPSA